MSLDIVILASGEGKRMKSSCPKVLHKLAGFTLINHVVKTANDLNPDNIIIVKDFKTDLSTYFKQSSKIKYANQKEKLGTAHAVHMAIPHISSDMVLVLYADTPMIKVSTLLHLIDLTASKKVDMSLLSFMPKGEHMYGRVLHNECGFVDSILEYGEDGYFNNTGNFVANSGVCIFKRSVLFDNITHIENNNKKKEYYLTDIVNIIAQKNGKILSINIDPNEACGVNSQKELAEADKILQMNLKEDLMNKGVVFIDSATSYVSLDAKIAKDVTIFPNTYIGVGVIVGSGVVIQSFSHLENTKIDPGTIVGPYAYVKGGSHLKQNSHIGCFVEINRSVIGPETKIKHLTYIGDAIIGMHCNIGAGTIFCNYNGVKKSVIKVGNNVFIGANNSIVAPLEIGDNVKTGASSVIRKNIDTDCFFVTRGTEYTKINRVKINF
ncbi:UDP-N-acetylglucosamine diphosphorylase/glucosamine-1-phosphate N-acetyltransferase [Anaplasmataceae bacterium AB001_6]|nr:UDP-N-acetylglucosamine diphosphorylase/glucosamine-1-phosphate N-acetyltransferase [Anaplasmataceae bacterium AB001_6]